MEITFNFKREVHTQKMNETRVKTDTFPHGKNDKGSNFKTARHSKALEGGGLSQASSTTTAVLYSTFTR